MNQFLCKVCDKVKEIPRPNRGARSIWLKENKGTLRLTCCECLELPDSDYITIIEEIKEGENERTPKQF